jgi:hypothetical protein
MSDKENIIQKKYQNICDKLKPYMKGDVQKALVESKLMDEFFQLLCGHISQMRFHVADYNNLGFRDFNKEIFHPDVNRKEYPNGCVMIRSDDNFWVEAVLPYEPYVNQHIKEICEQLWPELKNESVKYHQDKIG